MGGSDCDIIEVPLRHLLGRAEEDREKPQDSSEAKDYVKQAGFGG
jgi:hypothetical protein